MSTVTVDRRSRLGLSPPPHCDIASNSRCCSEVNRGMNITDLSSLEEKSAMPRLVGETFGGMSSVWHKGAEEVTLPVCGSSQCSSHRGALCRSWGLQYRGQQCRW